MRRIASWIIFPATIAACFFAAQVLRRSTPLPLAVIVGAIAFATGVWILILERLHPHAPQWNESRGDIATDSLHMAFSQVLPMQIVNALCTAAFVALSVWLSERIGFGLWPSSWPLAAQVLLALAIAEFPYYWWHRACHELPFLWRFHAIHHSAERLYFLNAGRFHPVDTIAGYGMQAALLLTLGAGAEVMALWGLFIAVHGLFQHCNVALRLGPLNYLFSMAEPHRWHHSKTIAIANHNYGGDLIVWDLVFGSFFLPRDRTPDPNDVGINGPPNFPKTWWAQIRSPFRRCANPN